MNKDILVTLLEDDVFCQKLDGIINGSRLAHPVSG